MGELLFWVGEDKLLFGSDYAIWEPKWQVEGFVDWDFPDDVAYDDYPRLGVEGKKKILGLNAAKLYGIEVPAEFQVAASPRRRTTPGWSKARREPTRPSRGSGHGLRPGARRADHDARLRRHLCGVRDRRRRRAPAAADAAVRAFAFLMAADARAAAVLALPEAREVTVVLEDHYTGEEINAAVGRGDSSAQRSRARPRATSTRCASCSAARRW